MNTFEDELAPHAETTPLGVKLLVCFLLLDSVRRVVEVAHGTGEVAGAPTAVFVLWAVIDLLLALLMMLRMRAGRYWTQAILAVHVFYLGYTLAYERPYLWLAMAPLLRGRIVATVFLDGVFAAYLLGDRARGWLDQGP